MAAIQDARLPISDIPAIISAEIIILIISNIETLVNNSILGQSIAPARAHFYPISKTMGPHMTRQIQSHNT